MSKGKIVSIHSFRGGTGKSNTTANLAAQVAIAGKRVGVVDTDIQSPGIHVLFGLDESKMGKTMNDFLHGKATIREIGFPIGENAAGAEGRAKLAGKNLWLFPSSISGREISQILKEGIDFNRLNEETLLSIATSDILIIILRPDNQDLQGTSVTVDIARSLDVPSLLLMVNKALPKYDFAQLKGEIEAKFNAPVSGILPLSFDMADNASTDLFSLRYPDHEWSRALRGVAEAVLAVK
jgi:septum site-determining protein MinD